MNAFEQAKMIKEQSRVLSLEEQVRVQLFPFHGYSGCKVVGLEVHKGDQKILSVTINGHVIHMQVGPTSITCYDMGSFSMELANAMSRYI